MLNPNLDEIQLNKQEYERYSRHLILPEVGLEGQKRLKAASVLCVGTGGLGSPLLLYLAAAGVGRIGIVDFDVVDHSNLQRQVIHGTSWVGKPKIESLRYYYRWYGQLSDSLFDERRFGAFEQAQRLRFHLPI